MLQEFSNKLEKNSVKLTLDVERFSAEVRKPIQ